MKKKIIIAVIIPIILVPIIYFILKDYSPTPTVITLGIMMPQTGAGSYWGKNGVKGIKLAFSELDTNKLKYKYKLIFEDSETEPKTAVTVFDKLIHSDKAKYCLVDMISSNVLAIAPIANRNKIIIISPGASSPNISSAGDYIFRNWPSDALQGEKDAKIATEVLNWSKIAILKINNEYGSGLSSAFKNSLDKRSASVIVEESYMKGDLDFKTQLFKIKQSKADGLFLLAYPEEIPLIISQIRELELTLPILGTETFENMELINKLGNATNGLMYTYPKTPSDTLTVVKDFRENFYKMYQEEFGVPADVAYDALNILVNAIERGNNDTESVKNELYKIINYNGASGNFSIDSNGDAIKEFELKVIKNGKFLIYEEAN